MVNPFHGVLLWALVGANMERLMMHRGLIRHRRVRLMRNMCAVSSAASTWHSPSQASATRRSQPGAGAPAVHGARAVSGLTKVPFKPAQVTVPVQTDRTFTVTHTRWPSAASGTIALAAPATAGQAVAVAVRAASVPAAKIAAALGTDVRGTVATAAGTPAWAQAVAPAHGGVYRATKRWRAGRAAVGRASGWAFAAWCGRCPACLAGAGGVRAGLATRASRRPTAGTTGCG